MIIPFTEKWMDSGNMWLQRSAILFQLKYKENTDFELLFEYSKRLSGCKEFFIRKAIGWALSILFLIFVFISIRISFGHWQKFNCFSD